MAKHSKSSAHPRRHYEYLEVPDWLLEDRNEIKASWNKGRRRPRRPMPDPDFIGPPTPFFEVPYCITKWSPRPSGLKHWLTTDLDCLTLPVWLLFDFGSEIVEALLRWRRSSKGLKPVPTRPSIAPRK